MSGDPATLAVALERRPIDAQHHSTAELLEVLEHCDDVMRHLRYDPHKHHLVDTMEALDEVLEARGVTL